MTTEVDTSEKVFEVLYQSKMAWTVGKEALYTEDGTITPAWCTRRSDTGAILGVVGGTYRPFQNQDLVQEFMEAIKEFNLSEIEGTVVNGGKKVVLKAKIGTIQVGTDLIHRYITGSNTHDGSAPIRLGIYHRVKVCSNGLHREINSRQLTTVKHTTNAGDKMSWYIRNIPVILAAEEQMMKNYQRWQEIPLTDEHVKEVIRKVYAVDPEEKLEDISPKKRAQVQRFYDNLKKNGIEVHGNNLWALLQTQTYISSRDTKGNLSDDKVMSGRTQEMSEMTYETLLQMVGGELEVA